MIAALLLPLVVALALSVPEACEADRPVLTHLIAVGRSHVR